MKRRNYTVPRIASIELNQPLLETISGANQGGGHNEGRPTQTKYSGYDFEEYEQEFENEE